MDDQPQFSKWRQRLWPIHRFELKKVVPLLFLKFLASFIYVLLFITKDTLIVTTAQSGAEVIPILKGWVVLPSALLILLAYTKASNKISLPTLAQIGILPFIIFFALFGFVLYPYREALIPHDFCNWLESVLGSNRSNWIAVIRYWMNSLFFVFAEMWAQVVIMILFWSYVNQITRIGEAKRYYTLFTAAGDFGPILAGGLASYLASARMGQNFDVTIRKVMTLVIVVGMLIIFVFRWLNRHVLSDKRYCDNKEERMKKPKLSLGESLKFICRSKYLGCLALMVVGCAIAVNLVEVTWKANLKLLYPDANQYQNFMGKFSIFCLGIVPMITAVFIGGNLLRKIGWFRTAILSPIFIGVSGVLFLTLFYFRDNIEPLTSVLGVTPLAFIVMFGTVQVLMFKALKYSLFDPTKEMAFIPLDPESKIKGKAAIDVVGSRLGKSGAGWIQAILIDVFGAGSIFGITAILIPIVGFVAVGWLLAVWSLNKEFTQLTEEAT